MASADTQLTVDDEPQSKKKKFMIVLGIGLLVLAAGGGFLLWKFVFHSSGGAGAEQASASSQVEPLKLTVQLEPFIVNLFDEKGFRYLKLRLDLEVTGCDEPYVQQRIPKIRDSLIILLSSKKYEEVGSIEGKIRLREEILYRLNSILGEGKAQEVFFTDFVVQ
jgi:flagellar FliL protein